MKDSTFKAAWWLRNPHLQTLWPALCRRQIKDLQVRHERFELPDGDFVDLNWVGQGQGPIVLVLHGFEGSIESHYAKGMLRAIMQQGWRGVFMHFRGCSGEPNRSPKNYHSGETSDLATVVNALCAREPRTALAAVGFSLGGNVLLKWLGETGSTNPLAAAIAISVPFELQKTSARINQGFSRLYEWYLLKCICERLQIKYQASVSPINLTALPQIQTIYDFDNQVTAPLYGFADALDYYKKSSSRQYLHAICVPTLLLQAKDDPFMTDDIVPAKSELSQHVQLELTEGGGHVGFVSGKFPWQAQYWLEQRAPLFLQEHLIC